MSDEQRYSLSYIAALFHDFASTQREVLIAQSRKQKITIVRNIGQVCQCTFETVVDEGTDTEEIYQLLAPIDAALDRIKAKSDLSDHFYRAMNKLSEIDMATQKLVAQRALFVERNALHSQGRRREQVGLTEAQQKELLANRQNIIGLWETVEDTQRAANETQRVIDGENPIVILREQIAKRIDELRASRMPTEAAE